MVRRVIVLVIAAAVGITAAVVRNGQAEKVEARIEATKSKLDAVIQRAKDSDKYAAFLDKHHDSADQYAMTIAYTPRSRGQSAGFDSTKYANAFAENLAAKAKMWKADDQGLSLFVRQLEIDVENAAKAGEFQ